jgi:hypothetical protein
VTRERPEESSRGAEIGKFVNGYVLTAIRRASAERTMSNVWAHRSPKETAFNRSRVDSPAC